MPAVKITRNVVLQESILHAPAVDTIPQVTPSQRSVTVQSLEESDSSANQILLERENTRPMTTLPTLDQVTEMCTTDNISFNCVSNFLSQDCCNFPEVTL